MVAATPADPFPPTAISDDMRGAIVVGGSRMTDETIRRAIEVGASGIISGGIDDQDLKNILGYDLGVAITGAENVGLTLIITEGFGDIAMATKTFELLKSCEGLAAAIDGATQIRAGVMRPQIVIPVPDAAAAPVEQASQMGGGVLDIGSTIRVIRDPYFGVIGDVVELPSDPAMLESGSKARVLIVDHDGERITVPRANVEIVGGSSA